MARGGCFTARDVALRHLILENQKSAQENKNPSSDKFLIQCLSLQKATGESPKFTSAVFFHGLISTGSLLSEDYYMDSSHQTHEV